jgi:hypothetical protein
VCGCTIHRVYHIVDITHVSSLRTVAVETHWSVLFDCSQPCAHRRRIRTRAKAIPTTP